MTIQKLFLLSDIHIGTNQPTNWYARTFHEPHLATALRYIAEQAKNGDVAELILLGDVVDQWMYLPTVQPPSFADIVADNPGIFADALPAAINAIAEAGGRTTYLNGNHDMAVTADEIRSVSEHIHYELGPFYVPESGVGQFVCTHGNLYSVFNAPNIAQHPPGTDNLPLGFFVSRLAARWSEQHGKPAYEQPDTGDPNGLDFDAQALEGVFRSILRGQGSLAHLIMSALLEATKNQDDSFIMADGSTVSVADVGTIYNHTFKDYPASTGVEHGSFGLLAAELALLDVDARGTLLHFAAELAKTYTVIAMGHTHTPVEHSAHILFHHHGLYVNSGFMCPSRPDVESGHKHPTFAQITVDTDARKFMASVHRTVDRGNGVYAVETDITTESIDFR